MKKLYTLLAFVFTIMYANSQQIISVAPNTVSPGTQATVLITTTGIYLSPTNTTVDFGPGITVKSTEVLQNQMVRSQLDVSSAAATGMRTIKVTSDGKEMEYPAFDVTPSGSGVIAFMEVVPVQKLYLTDLDPNNPELAPLLFSVTINNDNAQHTFVARLTITGDNTGEWGTATKTIANVQPNAIVRFNNKEFDSYKVSTGNRDRMEEAAKQGRLPTDVYEYKVEIFEGPNKITETTGRNIVDNPIARPELIGPGTPLNLQPEEVTTATPFFQWFSQASTHTVSVYPVFNNQTTREEITLNRPVWTQNDVSGKNIVYPVSAELLQEGVTYAWQVVGIINSAKGEEKLYSDVFWFTYKKSGLKNTVYARLVIEPEMPAVKTGQVVKFTIYGIDENNVRYDISDKVVWKVLPASLGTITPTGNFTAGRYPENVAVVAQYGSEQVFADVTITENTAALIEAWNMEVFLKQLFGLP